MADRPPNILWLCTDQQRFDTLGCMGNPYVETASIDALADDGFVFDHAYCQSPICTPSRASFLTGRYPRTTRCRENGQTIPADEILVTRILADVGYNCGLAGKLHLSPAHPTVPFTSERRINDGYAEFHWSHSGQHRSPSNEYTHWLRDRGERFAVSPYNGSPRVMAGMPAELHQTTWCARKAINFIEANAGREQPWLFSVNFFDPHHPFDPPLSYLNRYLDQLDALPLPNYVPGELADKPHIQRKSSAGEDGRESEFAYDQMDQREHRLVRAAYWAMIDLLDDAVGAIIGALRETGQDEDTLVIFMSDHGEMLGDHGIYTKGAFFYEPLVRVPLIIRYPRRIQPKHRSMDLVELVDLAPTLLDAAGLPRQPGMQGRSLWPLLTGAAQNALRRTSVYCENYNASSKHWPEIVYGTMLRTERYKLVRLHGGGEGELYDLAEDPDETTNRWHDPVMSAVKLDLLTLLSDRMAWTSDPLPQREAPF